MRHYFLIIWALSFVLPQDGISQEKKGEAKLVDDLNSSIDHAVTARNFQTLEKYYADDFVFTHGTGLVDSKESWLKSIRNMGEARFLSREHDSTVVELHQDVAIIFGKLSVARESKGEVRRYYLHYVRVFARRKDVWQMISHRTTKEWH